MSRSIRGTRDTQEMIALTRDFLAAQSPSRERSTLVPLGPHSWSLTHDTKNQKVWTCGGKTVSYSRIIKTVSNTLLLAPSTLRSRKD